MNDNDKVKEKYEKHVNNGYEKINNIRNWLNKSLKNLDEENIKEAKSNIKTAKSMLGDLGRFIE